MQVDGVMGFAAGILADNDVKIHPKLANLKGLLDFLFSTLPEPHFWCGPGLLPITIAAEVMPSVVALVPWMLQALELAVPHFQLIEGNVV